MFRPGWGSTDTAANLEHLRQRAKDLLRAQHRTDPEASLSAAQLMIAGEHGFRAFRRWAPSDDPQVSPRRGAGLCRPRGRVNMRDPLVADGARLEADVYNGDATDLGRLDRPVCGAT